MAASSRAQVLDLYRAMLRESKRFGAYNYRTYAIRRIRDAFRENKNVKDPAEIQALVNKARRDLGIIRRQLFQRRQWHPHSSTLAWKIAWIEEPGGLQSIGSRRVRHESTLAKCIRPTSLSSRIKRSPGPRSRDQPPAAAWTTGSTVLLAVGPPAGLEGPPHQL
ncbi:LYR motif-containing protein 4 isoform X1 [Ovis aries]|uniref:Uncharacterized protein n=1 Tax=Ovis aries TaxID=9940 RepID=A0AC11DM46_SHEEP|nr:LYR motif-containing protein 4 isoform X1 [Ovis aries]